MSNSRYFSTCPAYIVISHFHNNSMLVAFGAGAAVGPLLTYVDTQAWQRGLDKRLLPLLSSTDHNNPAWAYDILTLTRGHLLHSHDLPLYAEIDGNAQQTFGERLHNFLHRHDYIDPPQKTSTHAAWPAALAGLFAGVFVQWPLEHLAIQTSPDPFWAECVRQYKSALRDLSLVKDAHCKDALAFAAAKLVVYAVTASAEDMLTMLSTDSVQWKRFGHEALDLTIYFE